MNKTLLTSLALFLSFIQVTYGALNIASYNIRNFDYDQRSGVKTNKNALADIINDLHSDLMGVQEINDVYAFETFVENSVIGSYSTKLTECGGAHGQKLGFMYNNQKLVLVNFHQDLRVSNVRNPSQAECNSGSRPLAIAEFTIRESGEKLIAISVHLKSGGRDKSVKKRFKQIKTLSQVVRDYTAKGIKNIVVMGDFNSTEFIFRGDLNRKFDTYVTNMGLTDTSKNLKCSAYWWGGLQDNRQHPSQLDHILMSENLAGYQEVSAKAYGHCAKLSCQVTRESNMGVSFDGVSDHCPIMTKVN